VDSGVRAGDAVGVHYDPMIAKLVVHGASRQQAVDRLCGALGATRIGPLASNLGFLRALSQHPQWRRSAVDTNFLARESAALATTRLDDDEALAAAASWMATAPPRTPATPWDLLRGMRLNLPSCHRLRLALTGEGCDVTLEPSPGRLRVHLPRAVYQADRPRRDGSTLCFQHGAIARRISVHEAGEMLHLDDGDALATVTLLPAAAPAGADQLHGAGQLIAPMPGRVVTLSARLGDRVEAGQALVVLEAMKMEHTLKAPAPGTVDHVGAREGAQVEEGTVLVSLVLD
jgi:3-methylcrotonyl-CoA carboxylase alpha subunit